MKLGLLVSLLLRLLPVAMGARIVSDIADLSWNEENRLNKHYLLIASSCDDEFKLNEVALRETVVVEGGIATEFNLAGGECNAVCLEQGVHRDQVHHPIPHNVFSTSGESEIFTWVSHTCQKVDVGFMNYAEHDGIIYWINNKGRRVKVADLKRGERNTAWHNSFLGHRFEIVDSINGQVLSNVTVKYHSINPIGSAPSALTKREVSKQVMNTFVAEWDRAHRVKRTFTEFGFDKGRLPHDLWGSISAYYYNNRHAKVIEEWDSKGLYVNWWEADVFMIPMPWDLKKYWQSRLKELVEKWSGAELELTDIYGMRRYEDGARLLTHVDRENTHAASLIINVAQGNIREPWSVEIYDHADRLHEIYMDEGDIVYYESARCLHGRMQPLKGGYYVNLFAHYRPTGDPQWFTRENPPHTPKPVIDIGECHSNGTHAHCSKRADIHSLSPKLETLHGPQDLYHFWESVAPKPEVAVEATGVSDEL